MAFAPFISIQPLDVASLGARPAGDPKALRALAKTLKAKSEQAGGACGTLAGVPASVIFEGPAGDRYRRYANATARAGDKIAGLFDAAAASAEADATKLFDDQRRWDKAYDALVEEHKEAQREANEKAAAKAKATR